jgi:cation transport ATPase
MDMMRWGYGIGFISFFLVISFAISSGIFASMARRLNSIFYDDKILAHWEYDKEEWLKYSDEEFKKQKSEKRIIFITIAVISIIVVGIFTLINRDAWKALFVVFAGLLALLALIAFIVPKIKYARDRKNIKPEVYISLNGIYLAGEFHIWNFLTSKLEETYFDEKKLIITINYSYMTRTGLSHTIARIPVPPEKSEDAKIIVEKLKKI